MSEVLEEKKRPGDFSPLWYADGPTFAEAEEIGFIEAVYGTGGWQDLPVGSLFSQQRTVAAWVLSHPDGRSVIIDHPKYRMWNGTTIRGGPRIVRFGDSEESAAFIDNLGVQGWSDPIGLRDVNSRFELNTFQLQDLEGTAQEQDKPAISGLKVLINRLRRRK